MDGVRFFSACRDSEAQGGVFVAVVGRALEGGGPGGGGGGGGGGAERPGDSKSWMAWAGPVMAGSLHVFCLDA